MAAAARLPGVDPQRLVLWGVSLAGGHVFEAAAGRDDVAAVVALTPLVDGLAAGRHALASTTPRQRSCARPSPASAAGSRPPRPVGGDDAGRGPARRAGGATLAGCYEDYLAIAGPSWRNEIDAAVGLELGGHRPAKQASG